MAKVEMKFGDPESTRVLFGQRDQNLRELERRLDVELAARGDTLQVGGSGHSVALAQDLLEQLYEMVKQGYPLYPTDIKQALDILSEDRSARLKDIFMDAVFVSSSRKTVVPKTLNQKRYIDAIREHDVVFGIGSAGTGKTYLAMAMALSALNKRLVKRIILVRPAVEAGEKLGFLPGDLSEKVNPYLRPLHDALFDMMDMDKAGELIQRGTIEVAPLAYMRGRTLNSSFVILDEAQNTTEEQMKMFLTRLGFDSKAVVTGDLTQTDLPNPRRSGLVQAAQILRGVEGLSFIHFTDKDVVRHPLVQKIIVAYEAASASRDAGAERPGNARDRGRAAADDEDDDRREEQGSGAADGA